MNIYYESWKAIMPLYVSLPQSYTYPEALMFIEYHIILEFCNPYFKNMKVHHVHLCILCSYWLITSSLWCHENLAYLIVSKHLGKL
jgi:hypothetical protein